MVYLTYCITMHGTRNIKKHKLNVLVACGVKMAKLVLQDHHQLRKGYGLITRTYPDVKFLSRHVLGCRACWCCVCQNQD